LFSQKITKKDVVTTPTSPSPSASTVLPLSLKKLKNPDLKFLDHETHAEKFGERINFVEKNSKKLCKLYAGLYCFLGA
jgi:hypothetical protein